MNALQNAILQLQLNWTINITEGLWNPYYALLQDWHWSTKSVKTENMHYSKLGGTTLSWEHCKDTIFPGEYWKKVIKIGD